MYKDDPELQSLLAKIPNRALNYVCLNSTGPPSPQILKTLHAIQDWCSLLQSHKFARTRVSKRRISSYLLAITGITFVVSGKELVWSISALTWLIFRPKLCLVNNDFGRGHEAYASKGHVKEMTNKKKGTVEKKDIDLGSFHMLHPKLQCSLLKTARKNANKYRAQFNAALKRQEDLKREMNELLLAK